MVVFRVARSSRLLPRSRCLSVRCRLVPFPLYCRSRPLRRVRYNPRSRQGFLRLVAADSISSVASPGRFVRARSNPRSGQVFLRTLQTVFIVLHLGLHSIARLWRYCNFGFGACSHLASLHLWAPPWTSSRMRWGGVLPLADRVPERPQLAPSPLPALFR